MNKAAIMLCQGDLVAAKNQLDELLEDQNLRVIQTDPNQNELIPDYLVNLLVYFLMVTSKYIIFNPAKRCVPICSNDSLRSTNLRTLGPSPSPSPSL